MVNREPKFLSHTLSSDSPVYAGNAQNGLGIELCSSIEKGDASNSAKYSLHGHLGTHIDCPRHFIRTGKTVDDYPPGFWFCNHISLIEVPSAPGLLIAPEHISKPLDPASEILLIRTGHEQCRDESKYWKEGPGVHASLAPWLREMCPQMRFIGFDFISLSSYLEREHGRVAHREFLGGEHPILIIEDMHLSELSQAPGTVLVSPLRVLGADGVPVTVFGWF